LTDARLLSRVVGPPARPTRWTASWSKDRRPFFPLPSCCSEPNSEFLTFSSDLADWTFPCVRGNASRIHTREDIMSFARVTEITSSSPTSFDEAMRAGLARANKTLENVSGAWIKNQEVV